MKSILFLRTILLVLFAAIIIPFTASAANTIYEGDLCDDTFGGGKCAEGLFCASMYSSGSTGECVRKGKKSIVRNEGPDTAYVVLPSFVKQQGGGSGLDGSQIETIPAAKSAEFTFRASVTYGPLMIFKTREQAANFVTGRFVVSFLEALWAMKKPQLGSAVEEAVAGTCGELCSSGPNSAFISDLLDKGVISLTPMIHSQDYTIRSKKFAESTPNQYATLIRPIEQDAYYTYREMAKEVPFDVSNSFGTPVSVKEETACYQAVSKRSTLNPSLRSPGHLVEPAVWTASTARMLCQGQINWEDFKKNCYSPAVGLLFGEKNLEYSGGKDFSFVAFISEEMRNDPASAKLTWMGAALGCKDKVNPRWMDYGLNIQTLAPRYSFIPTVSSEGPVIGDRDWRVTPLRCADRCSTYPNCAGFNYDRVAGLCTLLSQIKLQPTTAKVSTDLFQRYQSDGKDAPQVVWSGRISPKNSLGQCLSGPPESGEGLPLGVNRCEAPARREGGSDADKWPGMWWNFTKDGELRLAYVRSSLCLTVGKFEQNMSGSYAKLTIETCDRRAEQSFAPLASGQLVMDKFCVEYFPTDGIKENRVRMTNCQPNAISLQGSPNLVQEWSFRPDFVFPEKSKVATAHYFPLNFTVRLLARQGATSVNVETGAPAISAHQPGWLSAQWKIAYSPESLGKFWIQNVWTNKLLTVANGRVDLGSPAPADPTVLFFPDQWTAVAAGRGENGLYHLKHVESSKYLVNSNGTLTVSDQPGDPWQLEIVEGPK